MIRLLLLNKENVDLETDLGVLTWKCFIFMYFSKAINIVSSLKIIICRGGDESYQSNLIELEDEPLDS